MDTNSILKRFTLLDDKSKYEEIIGKRNFCIVLYRENIIYAKLVLINVENLTIERKREIASEKLLDIILKGSISHFYLESKNHPNLYESLEKLKLNIDNA